MGNEVKVDPAVVWAAAASTRRLADDTDAPLKRTEDSALGCSRGWGPRSSREFDGFVDRLTQQRRMLSTALDGLDQGLRAAAHGYEQADSDTGEHITAAAAPTLRL